jgi:hypothetical protein
MTSKELVEKSCAMRGASRGPAGAVGQGTHRLSSEEPRKLTLRKGCYARSIRDQLGEQHKGLIAEVLLDDVSYILLPCVWVPLKAIMRDRRQAMHRHKREVMV